MRSSGAPTWSPSSPTTRHLRLVGALLLEQNYEWAVQPASRGADHPCNAGGTATNAVRYTTSRDIIPPKLDRLNTAHEASKRPCLNSQVKGTLALNCGLVIEGELCGAVVVPGPLERSSGCLASAVRDEHNSSLDPTFIQALDRIVYRVPRHHRNRDSRQLSFTRHAYHVAQVVERTGNASPNRE